MRGLVQLRRSRCGLARALALCSLACIPTVAFAQTPLDEPGPAYLGQFPLGLYPTGNQMPAAHRDEGSSRARNLTPLDAAGAPSAGGHIVLLSIGGTDASEEFCTDSNANPPVTNMRGPVCNGQSLLGHIQYRGYGLVEMVNDTTLAIANGAYPDQFAPNWEHDNTPFSTIPPNPMYPPVTGNYTRIRDNVLGRFSSTTTLTEAQVQVAWIRVWNPNPSVSLPAANADAYDLETRLGNIVRLMKARYPNLQIVFLSSREYGGYATSTLNPEPYAYESGFAVKWLIEAQIDQMASGGTVVDPRAGDLNYTTGVAPWIAWGPYVWSNGAAARLDGPNWVPQDFDPASPSFSTYKSLQGQSKLGLVLLRFFTLSPFTKCWFMRVAFCQ